MIRYSLEIDYEDVYDIESITETTCTYTTDGSDTFTVDLETVVTYRTYTSLVVESLTDLKNALKYKDLVVIYDEGGCLVDYPEVGLWENEKDYRFFDWDENIVTYLNRGLIGRFSKEKQCKLRTFLELIEYEA